MSERLDREIERELTDLADRGLGRTLVRLSGPRGREFTCSDYLGFSNRPDIVAGVVRAVETHGAGARASRLLGGGAAVDLEVERLAADWLDAEAALLFPSGYQANLGLITTLAGAGSRLFCDRLNHASLIDAARLSHGKVAIYRHADPEDLERLLRAAPSTGRRLVVTESVFSMDGDLAPLADLSEVCLRHGAQLVVDEAHAAGVVGPKGAGGWAGCGLPTDGDSPLAARVITGGKALGVGGALVVGSARLRELLVHRARSFIFTTGVAPAVAGGLEAALRAAPAADEERRAVRLATEILAEELGMPAPSGAIIPWLVGESRRAMAVGAELREAGFEVHAVRPPTVPEGTARIRLVCHAYNPPEVIRDLGRTLRRSEGAAAVLRVAVDTPALPENPRPLVVVGTDTEVGKTVASALLALAAQREGTVTYWKPVQTGTDDDTFAVRELVAGSAVRLADPVYRFALPASPHEAAEDEESVVDLERIEVELGRLVEQPGRLILELAGGLLVPYTLETTQADWLTRLAHGPHRPQTVLVARSGLGTLNHTELTVEALSGRGLRPETILLFGPRHPSNERTLRRRLRLPVVSVPWFEPLSGESLRDWLGHRRLADLLDPQEAEELQPVRSGR